MEEKKLRNGYTTGSCAAAAAKAAATDLLTAVHPESVIITLPGGEKAEFPVEKVNGPSCCYRVQKNSGDDPDVTDKSFIHAACSFISSAGADRFRVNGRGYIMEGRPRICIDGEDGIGLVTMEGLACPVGHYAINPVPREEIACAVREVCALAGRYEDLLLTLSVPEGEVLAAKTFNPRLGITGGISILGTSGLVRPMSDDAILQTIRLELHMRAVSGKKKVILTPGNYGEKFLKEEFGIPEGTAVQISNFVKDSLQMVCEEGFTSVLFAGHIGKLIKVAAGIPNTHSRYGDKRMETFLTMLDRTGIISEGIVGITGCEIKLPGEDLTGSIMAAATTDEALSILADAFPSDAGKVVSDLLDETAKAVKCQMEEWTGGDLITEVVVFSREGDVGATKRAKEYFSL